MRRALALMAMLRCLLVCDADWPAVSYRLAVASFDARLIWDGEMAGEVGDG